VKDVFHPNELSWGSACYCRIAPVLFQLRSARYWAFFHLYMPAQGCSCRQWRCQPSWRASRGSTCCFSSPRSLLLVLCPHPDYNMRGLTTSYCAHRQLEWIHCRLQSGLLTWHPSGSTDNSLLLKCFHLIARGHQQADVVWIEEEFWTPWSEITHNLVSGGWYQIWASYFQGVTCLGFVCWMGQNKCGRLSVAVLFEVISAESCPLH
jgi:hypothetical protein